MASTVGPTGGSSSYVGSDQQFSSVGHNASLSSSPLFSFVLSLRESIIQLSVTLQSKEPIIDKPIVAFVTIIQLYILISSMFLPTITLGSAIEATSNTTLLYQSQNDNEPYYKYGLYGNWIFNVINFSITFSLDRVDYYVILGLAFACITATFSYLLLIIANFRSMLSATRHLEKLKGISRKVSGLLIISSLTMTFILTSFLDCIYLTGSLNRFSGNVSCFSGENIAYIVLSLIGMLCLFICLQFALSVSPNIHPLSKTIFITQNPFTTSIYWVTTNIELLIIYTIPTGFGRAIVHTILSIVQLYFHAKYIPFYRRVENSIYCAFLSARLGAGVGSLISSLVNTRNLWDFGLGMTGLTLGLMISGFSLGFISMEIYTRVIRNSTREVLLMKDGDSEKDILVQYQYFEDTKRMKHLLLFLRFCVSCNDNDIRDVEIALSFIKSLINNRSVQNIDLMIISAIIATYKWQKEANSTAFSLRVIRNAMRQHGLNSLSKFSLLQTLKQIETFSESISNQKKNTSELKAALLRLEKLQTDLFSQHKNFWKEMANDIVDFEKLEKISTNINLLYLLCDKTFTNLILSFGNEKTLIRKYAYFVENFKFDANQAQILYTEASMIEDEESKTKRRNIVGESVSRNSLFPVGNSMDFDHLKRLNSATPGSGLKDGVSDKRLESQPANNQSSDHQLTDATDIEQKKEIMFKSALAIQEPHRYVKTVVLGWTLLTLFLITAFVVLSSVLSVIPSMQIDYLRDSCQPKGAISRLIIEIRTSQAFLDIYGANSTVSHFIRSMGFNNSLHFLSEFKVKVLDAFVPFSQITTNSESLTDYMKFKLYTNSTFDVLIPCLLDLSTKTTEPNYVTTISETVSIFDISHKLKYHQRSIDQFTVSDLKNSIENYSLMFLFRNRENIENAFSDFCKSVSLQTTNTSETFILGFLGFFVSSIALYMLGGSVIFILTFVHLFRKNSLLMLLDKEIPKSIISRVINQISKKSDEELSEEKPNYLEPKKMVLVFGGLYLILTTTCLTMLFVSVLINNNQVLASINNLQLVSNAKSAMENAHFKIGELFIYKKMNGSFMNDPRVFTPEIISNFSKRIRHDLQQVSTEWNKAIYELDVSSNSEISKYITGTDSCNNTNTCKGLNFLISEFIVSSQQLIEKIQSESLLIDMVDLFDEYISLFFLGQVVDDKVLELEDYFVMLSAQSNTSVLIVFSVLGFVECLLFAYTIFSSYSAHWNILQSIRMLLNYIPWDVLDSNDKIKNFILYHDLSEATTRRFSFKKLEGNSQDKVRSILNSSIDGAILCNQLGDIELFNPASQKLFGHKPHEIVGLNVFTLFEPTCNSKIKQIMEDTCKVLIDNIGKKNFEPLTGETIEIDCFRKNHSKFPARVNLQFSLFGKTPILVFLVKDITFERKQNQLIAEEKKKSEALLLNILPEAVAIRLKLGETYIADKFSDTTIFFSDMVGFTNLSANMEAFELIKMLSKIIKGIDALTDKYALEKIKTIGDSYFAAGGLHGNSEKDHPERVLKFAIEAFSIVHNYNSEMIKEEQLMKLPKKYDENGVEIPAEKRQLNFRCGMNSGSVVAGVIGSKKFAYDLWGDAINMASRMESTCEPGRIQLSITSYERVSSLGYGFEEKHLDVKGKGLCCAYVLDSRFHTSAILDEEAITKLFSFENDSEKESGDEFNDIDLYRVDSYRFAKLILEHSFIASFKEYLTGPKLDIISFYERVIEYKGNESIPVRYEISKGLVETYLQEKAVKRLNFKFIKNAFGPFQVKFNTCNEDYCPIDLFDNFVNLSIKILRPEFPKFLKSSNFSSYIENIRVTDSDLLKSLLKFSKDDTSSSSSDVYDEEEEKKLLLFCEKCGTEIINLENNRFNDFEFNYCLESLKDFNQWRVLSEYDDGKTYISPEQHHNHLASSRRHTMLKYVFEVDYYFEEVFNLWMDQDYFSSRDENIISFIPIDFIRVGKYAHGIAHEIYKFNKIGQSDREIVHAYCCRFDKDEQRFLCISRSINTPKVVETSKYIRAEIKTAFMVENISQNRSRYTYSVVFDPMGLLSPDHFYSSIIKDTKNTFHDHLKSLLKNREIQKNHERPKVGLFVQSLDHYLNTMEAKNTTQEKSCLPQSTVIRVSSVESMDEIKI